MWRAKIVEYLSRRNRTEKSADDDVLLSENTMKVFNNGKQILDCMIVNVTFNVTVARTGKFTMSVCFCVYHHHQHYPSPEPSEPSDPSGPSSGPASDPPKKKKKKTLIGK